MDVRQLRYFCMAFEKQSISRAAEALFLAQPALSLQIQRLESELNVTLFIRHARGIRPTHEAILLYRHARAILRQIETTAAILGRKGDQPITGTVSIAMPSSTSQLIALPLMRQINEALPSVVLEIVIRPSDDLTRQVISGRVDFSLTPDQQPVYGVVTEPLWIEEILLLAPTSFQFSGSTVAVQDLTNIPLILPSMPNKLRSRLEHLFLEARQSYQLFAESSTTALLVPATVEGLAATLLPYSAAAHEIENQLIQALPFTQPFKREISLVYTDSLALTPAAKGVLSLLIKLINTFINTGKWRRCQWIGTRSSDSL